MVNGEINFRRHRHHLGLLENNERKTAFYPSSPKVPCKCGHLGLWDNDLTSRKSWPKRSFW